MSILSVFFLIFSIIKFAGDAMLVVWRNSILNLDDVAVDEIDFLSNPDIEAPNNEDLSTLLLRAVGCNLHLIQTLNHFSPTDGIYNVSLYIILLQALCFSYILELESVNLLDSLLEEFKITGNFL